MTTTDARGRRSGPELDHPDRITWEDIAEAHERAPIRIQRLGEVIGEVAEAWEDWDPFDSEGSPDEA